MDQSNSETPDIPVDDNSATEPTWWLDDKTPGAGDRPEWLAEKFKSASDMAKSYSELEKRFGSAPKEYDLSKGSQWADAENQHLKGLLDFAKSKGVSQDIMDKMLESVGSYIGEYIIDEDKEREKLGDDANDRIALLENWAEANFSKETFQALSDSITTAEGFKALEEVRNKMLGNNTKVPTENENPGSADTEQSLQQEIIDNFEKYNTDTAYRKSLEARMSVILGDKPDYEIKS